MLNNVSFPEMFGNNGYNDRNISNNDDHDIRAIHNRYDTFPVTERNAKICIENDNTENDVNINIFRYKFTDELTNELFKFSKIQLS